MSENRAHETLLRFWVAQGWRYRRRENARMNDKSYVQEYKSRIKLEFDVIVEKDFVDYFLIVSDLVRYAKDNGIAVGPGRGSSAGSLICYLLRITEVDSMQFPVLFERFLDPTRTDPPDIDIDFQDQQRDAIFFYAAEKYGDEFVANIGTYTRYKGRNSLDDVGRVYRIPKWKIENVKDKLLDREAGHPRFAKSLVDTYNTFPEINDLVNKTPELRYAPKLEGNYRNFGIHAAGMVISTVPIHEVCSTFPKKIGGGRGGTGQRSGYTSDRGSGTQGIPRERDFRAIAFDKYDAAYLGLLKIDALSLSTLEVLTTTCDLAGIPFNDLYRKPLTDKTVLDAFTRGDVLGIFQFEGVTTRRILKAVEPTEFMHLSDINALSRPGAQDKEYVFNKANFGEGGPGAEEFAHPVMHQHLSWTYGVIVYEEQILMILRDLGGFEPKELNRMRKIIHDKLGGTVFNEYFARFTKGAAAQGVSEDDARSIWDSMVNASGYAFNIAHSVSYTMISYWCQWLKINYPAEFYTGLLTRGGDAARRAKIINEAEQAGIEVRALDLLESEGSWTLAQKPSGPMILAGFSMIEGIGEVKTDDILEWREKRKAEPLFGGIEVNDLLEVHGIGKETVKKIQKFMDDPDPFQTGHLSRVLNGKRKAIRRGDYAGVPTPTHTSVEIPLDNQFVVFIGILRVRKYYDAAIQKAKRENIDEIEAYENLRDKHLLKYVALTCEDEAGEQVRISVHRWLYPKFARQIEAAKVNRSLVVAQGFSSDFQGISINAKSLQVMEP